MYHCPVVEVSQRCDDWELQVALFENRWWGVPNPMPWEGTRKRHDRSVVVVPTIGRKQFVLAMTSARESLSQRGSTIAFVLDRLAR